VSDCPDGISGKDLFAKADWRNSDGVLDEFFLSER